MFVVSLAALDNGIAVVVELARFFFNLRLAAKEDALRADDAGTSIVRERGKNVEDEGVITIAGGWRAERRAPPEAAKRVLVALFAEGLFLELVLLLFVVRLLLRLQPPKFVREWKIGEDEGELFHLAV